MAYGNLTYGRKVPGMHGTLSERSDDDAFLARGDARSLLRRAARRAVHLAKWTAIYVHTERYGHMLPGMYGTLSGQSIDDAFLQGLLEIKDTHRPEGGPMPLSLAQS